MTTPWIGNLAGGDVFETETTSAPVTMSEGVATSQRDPFSKNRTTSTLPNHYLKFHSSLLFPLLSTEACTNIGKSQDDQRGARRGGAPRTNTVASTKHHVHRRGNTVRAHLKGTDMIYKRRIVRYQSYVFLISASLTNTSPISDQKFTKTCLHIR